MKPILFNTREVQATLGGRMTTVWRVIKPQPIIYGLLESYWNWSGIKPTYRAGDILYVRETLFRAKTELECDVVTGETVKNPKWVYGYVDLRYMHNGFGVVIIDEKANKTYLCQYRTIGQYTGSPDRNEKKKIFEGDICQFYDDDGESSLYVVIWEGFGWKVKDVCSGMMDDLNEFFCKRCEVIGNIFDNPELLKGDAENE